MDVVSWSTADGTSHGATPLSRLQGMRFVGIFALLFSVGQYATVSARTYIADWLVVAPSAWTLSALYPADGIVVDANSVVSQRVRLNVLPGCEGTELFILPVAGIAAYPASLRARATGLALGLPLAFALNQVRVLALYATVRDHPAHFELVHAWLAPTLLVACLGCFYAWWTSRALPAAR
jgi:exosortase family protein XrtM